jgi:hypothetical protein
MKKFFSNIKNKIEMKFLDIFLARILDSFKAKSPKTYATIMLIATGLHVTATGWIQNYELFVAQNPDMANHVEAFAGVNPLLAQGVYYLSLGLMVLSGAHTSDILKKEDVKPVK